MGRERPPARVERSWVTRLQGLVKRLNLRPGEVAELLDRLPFTAAEGERGSASQRWQRRLAQRTLEAYAARKRAVARLARLGRL